MDSNKLRPPPVSAQGRSVINARVEGFRLIVVPPAATTLGATLGHAVPGKSPVEAKNTTPDWITGLDKVRVEAGFAGEFSAAPTIGNLTATRSGHKSSSFGFSGQQISEAVRRCLNQDDPGAWRDRMCPLYVERFLKLQSSRGVLRRPRSTCENLAEVCCRQTKLRRKLCQVGGGIWIIKRVHDGYHFAAACRIDGRGERITP